jgi:hypothetical protein
MKTVQGYLNDLRITGDKGLMSSPEKIRIIHAIRSHSGVVLTEKEPGFPDPCTL